MRDSKAAFDLLTADDVSELHKGMLGIDHFKERLVKQCAALWNNWLGPHKFPSEFSRIRYKVISFLANSNDGEVVEVCLESFRLQSQINQGVQRCSVRTSYTGKVGWNIRN